MEYFRGTLRALLGQQNGHVQVLIIAPILALSFLGAVVRAASSAVDHTLAQNAVIAQLQQRLSEIHHKTTDSFEPTLSQQELKQEPHQGFKKELKQELKQELGLPLESITSDEAATPVEEDEAPSVKVAILPSSQHDTPALELHQSVHFIKRNETLATILKKEGLPRRQTASWLTAARKMDELRRLQLGHAMTLSYDHDTSGTPTLRTVAYNINKRSLFVLEKGENGRIQSRVETVPTTLVWRAVGGRITGSLYQAATKMGVPARVVDDLADLDWELNLSSEIQPGAVFKIIYEEMQSNGETISHGRVLAAEIVNNGKTYTTLSLEPEEEYHADRGLRRGSQFLRYPVRFTRISSVFTDARFHPIYKRKRPHLGVDFAAPTGTPVRAVADGKVTYSGWKGAYGRFLQIDHAGPYSSAYAHLRRIKKGVKVGSVVKRGQIIGHVGSSGAATGPHLHFEMHKNGKYINPLKAKVNIKKFVARQKRKDSKPLDPQLAALKKKLEGYLAALSVEDKPESRIYTAIPRVRTAARKAADPRA